MAGKNPLVNDQTFGKLKLGMTLEQVQALLGEGTSSRDGQIPAGLKERLDDPQVEGRIAGFEPRRWRLWRGSAATIFVGPSDAADGDRVSVLAMTTTKGVKLECGRGVVDNAGVAAAPAEPVPANKLLPATKPAPATTPAKKNAKPQPSPPGPDPLAKVSPEVKAVLEPCRAAYVNLKTLAVKGTIEVKMAPRGEPLKDKNLYTFSALFNFPSQLRIERLVKPGFPQPGPPRTLVVSAGDVLYHYYPEGVFKFGSVSPMPGSKFGAEGVRSPAVVGLEYWLLLPQYQDVVGRLLAFHSPPQRVTDVEIDRKKYSAIIMKKSIEFPKTLTVLFDPTTHLLRRITSEQVVATSDSLTVFDFTDTRPNVAVDSQEFNWSPPGDATIQKLGW
jgi:hypothetical protein